MVFPLPRLLTFGKTGPQEARAWKKEWLRVAREQAASDRAREA